MELSRWKKCQRKRKLCEEIAAEEETNGSQLVQACAFYKIQHPQQIRKQHEWNITKMKWPQQTSTASMVEKSVPVSENDASTAKAAITAYKARTEYVATVKGRVLYDGLTGNWKNEKTRGAILDDSVVPILEIADVKNEREAIQADIVRRMRPKGVCADDATTQWIAIAPTSDCCKNATRETKSRVRGQMCCAFTTK